MGSFMPQYSGRPLRVACIPDFSRCPNCQSSVSSSPRQIHPLGGRAGPLTHKRTGLPTAALHPSGPERGMRGRVHCRIGRQQTRAVIRNSERQGQDFNARVSLPQAAFPAQCQASYPEVSRVSPGLLEARIHFVGECHRHQVSHAALNPNYRLQVLMARKRALPVRSQKKQPIPQLRCMMTRANGSRMAAASRRRKPTITDPTTMTSA